MIRQIVKWTYPALDNIYRKIDRRHIRRTKNIRLIPDFKNRRGGKLSYAEWAHVIGIFQTIIYQTLEDKTGNHILDAGCGTGLLGIASEPFTFGGGTYTGIDIMKYEIDFCTNHYRADNYDFIHFDISNPRYAPSQNSELKPWPIENDSKDLVTALSVWTHLNEKDATFYFKEISRVLKKGSKAIITFFYLDEKYDESLAKRTNEEARFHFGNQNQMLFETNAYGSENWLTPKWVKHPEDVIGISKKGLELLLANSGLKLAEYYPGNWKEIPGVFYQDILIFEK